MAGVELSPISDGESQDDLKQLVHLEPVELHDHDESDGTKASWWAMSWLLLSGAPARSSPVSELGLQMWWVVLYFLFRE